MKHKNTTKGWGKVDNEGSEIWDTDPIFKNDKVELKDWSKLSFYPKKWFLYRFIKKHIKKVDQPAILDVGCGTGATLIDFKRMFGRRVKVVGVDVIHMQVDLAKEKIKKSGVWAEVDHFDGINLPFSDNSFDAIYTSDVLGHVDHVEAWLSELNRVLKPGGVLAMFSESKLGKHAYIRNYLLKRGLNVDPHAEFHISLYSKTMLKELIERAGFEIKSMRTAFWASFFVHPDEFHRSFDIDNTDHKFFILKNLNKILYRIKKILHPVSTAGCELYGLVEMYVVGKYVEAQGYIILAKKR
jgi:ubiquinone/menaquinone biosynthesis C-methylase UbiE